MVGIGLVLVLLTQAYCGFIFFIYTRLFGADYQQEIFEQIFTDSDSLAVSEVVSLD